MQNKHFNQKRILGILKTYHAKQRQKERNITDKQLVKILQNGEFEERSEHEVIITLDGYHIYLSQDLEKIITVTAPDKLPAEPKVLSGVTGKKLKREINEVLNNNEDQDEKEMSFDYYMRNKFK